ncbi:MAG TPA: hypothetical protein VKA08_15500 [Balneolales bacterium]|nr:hypothetical protein [Balneolales bacterium]
MKTDTTSEEIQSLWELKYTGHTDSITVVSSRNTLRFDFPQGFPGTKLIVFPLKVGKKWSDANSSYAVVSKDTVSWSGGTFYKSYQIVQKASKKPNNDIQSITHDTTNYWIEPGIGIVKVRQFEYIAGPPGMADYVSDTVWMLLSYKINQM